ncbi:MAG: glycine--tRNA ligase subunit beta [Firmicutes bacterium HGW-Firmicutes-15]|nr:MAG: glycine--tRNA ligase subunit beta [Firmicutes bacterium HGW-Firmicutes-15]
MNKDFLLEIGVEEMPSAFMGRSLEDFKTITAQKLQEKRIKYISVDTLGTPRRLVLHIKGLEENQDDALIENKGPKKSSAFDQDGSPSKAAMGFARGQGIEVSDLEIREVAGVEYVFAIKKEVGGQTEDLLSGILLDIINSLSFPKSMRWGYYHTRFARPIRWLLALYGDKAINLQVENVLSSNYTSGHRFLAPEPILVESIDGYFTALRDHYVIVDQVERKKMIWQQVQDVAKNAGGRAMDNEDLLNEVSFLLEYPTAFYGEFSVSYLDVPPEVLTTSMIEHQRYFPLFDDENKLLPAFIGVRNGTDFRLDLVKAGNERVLKARLEDALFFWKEDTQKPLAEMVPGLKEVLFHERLGSLLDKVGRLRDMAVYVGQENGLSTPEKLDRAAFLCKADLRSNMVYEFPELQGIMGRYYANEGGEDSEVADAILEHYLPRFAGDSLPASETGIVLSLAEKLCNLTAFFAIGIKPSGSQDPYALRRQALGIVNIIIDLGLKSDLRQLIGQAYEGLQMLSPDRNREDTVNDLMDFILQRMRGIMLDRGLSYDVIDGVLYQAGGDLSEIMLRAEVLRKFKMASQWEDFQVVFNRSYNLSRKWESAAVRTELLEDASEKALYQHYLQLRPMVEIAVKEKRYEAALEMLAGMRTDIDQFFEAVMVMVEDEELKAARLGILKAIVGLCNFLADFSKVMP